MVKSRYMLVAKVLIAASVLLVLSTTIVCIMWAREVTGSTPVSVAYAEMNPHTPTHIMLYDGRHVRSAARFGKWVDVDLLGYDTVKQRWVCSVSSHPYIRTIGKDGEHGASLEGRSADSALACASFSDNSRWVPDLSNGGLVVKEYNSDGKLLSERHMSIKGDVITDFTYNLQVSRRGLIAIPLSTEKKPEDHIYIFNMQGHLEAIAGEGDFPSFNAAGTKLVFRVIINPGWISKEGVVIYDVKTGQRQILHIQYPPATMVSRYLPLPVDSMLDCKWGPSDDTLIAQYGRVWSGDRPMYLIRRDGGSLKWHKLPFCVESNYVVMPEKR